MNKYSEECLEFFLENQGKLFDEKVADSMEEAEEFLEDSLAVVVNSLMEVQRYFDESGMDTSDMSLDELAEAAEVFQIPDGTYLIVEA